MKLDGRSREGKKMTKQQDENGPKCLAVRDRDRQWRSAVNAGASNWSQESQQTSRLLLLASALQSLI